MSDKKLYRKIVRGRKYYYRREKTKNGKWKYVYVGSYETLLHFLSLELDTIIEEAKKKLEAIDREHNNKIKKTLGYENFILYLRELLKKIAER